MVVQSLLNGWHYFSNEHHLLMRGKNGCNFMITACQTPYRVWSFPLSLSHPDEIPPHFSYVNLNWNVIWLSVAFFIFTKLKRNDKSFSTINQSFFELLAPIKWKSSTDEVSTWLRCLHLSVFLSFPSALKRNEGPFHLFTVQSLTRGFADEKLVWCLRYVMRVYQL